MPFIEVWVDDECPGECSSAKEAERLEALVAEAADLLRRGESAAALHALTGDVALMCKSPDTIKREYEDWKACRLPGFANYARPERAS